MSSSRNKAIIRYNTGEEDIPSTSDDQRSGTSSKRRKNQPNNGSDQQLDSDYIERIVCDCVKYLLICDNKKTAVKRIDLFKAVVKQTPNRKIIDDIMKKVRSQLSQVFGIELTECPEIANSYILVNKLPANELKEAIDSNCLSDCQHLQTGLLVPVLSVIFMSGGSVREEVIWKFIEKLGFDANSKTKTIEIENDSTGITIKKLFTELWVRQLYLKYQKIPRSEPIVHEFKWGFRAEKEFSKMDILKFVCDVFADGSQPEYWRTQYAIAKEDIQTDNENEPEIEVIP